MLFQRVFFFSEHVYWRIFLLSWEVVYNGNRNGNASSVSIEDAANATLDTLLFQRVRCIRWH